MDAIGTRVAGRSHQLRTLRMQHARTHTGTHSRTHARLPEVPPPPLPLPSAVLAVLHHAGAPVDRARRVPHATLRLHDVRRMMHRRLLLMPTCRPCATPPSRIFFRKSIN